MHLSLRPALCVLFLGLLAGCGPRRQDPAVSDSDPSRKPPVIASAAAFPMPESLAQAGTGDVTIAASVDGVKLTKEELWNQLKDILAAKSVPAEEQPMAIQYYAPRLVGSFVNKTLLLEEARRLKLAVDAEDRKKYLQPIEQMAAARGMTLDELLKKMPSGEQKARQDLEEEMLIDKLIDSQLRGKLKLDETVETAFADAARERTAKRAAIDAIRAQLLAGTNFEALARERSDCPSGKRAGGDLGKFGRGETAKEFEEAAFAQKVGEIGPVVETPFGFHVIKVTARDQARAVEGEAPAQPETVQASHILVKCPPALSKEALRTQIEDRQMGEEMRAYIGSLSRKAKIVTLFDRPGGAPFGPSTNPPPEELPE